MVKKIIQKLTIIFALIFVFIPNNTFAYELGTYKYSLTVVGMSSNESNFTQNTYTYWAPDTTVKSYWNMNLSVRGNPQVANGSYIVFDYFVFNRMSSLPDICPTSSSNFSILSCTTTYALVDTEGTFKTYGYQVDTDGRGGWLYPSTMPSALTDTWQGNSYIVSAHQLVLKVNRDYTSLQNINLGGVFASRETTNTSGGVFIKFSGINIYDKGTELSDILNYLEEHPDSAGEQMEQDKQEQQQNGQNSETNSNQSGQDVQQNTTSILNAITGFFSAFTSATPTNCNMDWGLSDYGFGVINMCQNPIPSEFQVILSIISLLIVIPMILWLFSSIINAFKEFQS